MRAVSISALVGFFALLAAAACGSATGTDQQPAAAGPDSADTRQITVGFNMKLTEAGVMKADLFGDTAITRPGETRTEIRKVRLTFWDQGGKAPSKLTSRTGEYDQGSGVMVARGNVVLVVPGEKGKGTRTIRTEELHYDQRGDRVWSDRETVIEEATRTLVTQGFTSDSRFTNITGNNARTIGGVPVSGGGIGL